MVPSTQSFPERDFLAVYLVRRGFIDRNWVPPFTSPLSEWPAIGPEPAQKLRQSHLGRFPVTPCFGQNAVLGARFSPNPQASAASITGQFRDAV
ncbi:hypothetical protein SBA4_5390008 [Candidatus Sulfopaludibacter sp. SbA4]|nr:hypothetical protein SBA4_5390008 [Candidatus Sulfopaludibacter sp. SbA4]